MFQKGGLQHGKLHLSDWLIERYQLKDNIVTTVTILVKRWWDFIIIVNFIKSKT